VKHITEQNNFVFLLFSLVLFLLLGAVVEQMQTDMGQLVVTSSTVVMLAVGIWSFKESKHWFLAGLGILAAIIVVVVIGFILESAGFRYIHLLLMLVFFIWTTWPPARCCLPVPSTITK